MIPCTRNSLALASMAMVPGVRVIELACDTKPTSVRWLGLKRTSVGLIGSVRMDDDLAHVPRRLDDLLQQARASKGARADRRPTGRPSWSTASMRRASHTTAAADPAPAISRNGVKKPDSSNQQAIQRSETEQLCGSRCCQLGKWVQVTLRLARCSVEPGQKLHQVDNERPTGATRIPRKRMAMATSISPWKLPALSQSFESSSRTGKRTLCDKQPTAASTSSNWWGCLCAGRDLACDPLFHGRDGNR